MPLSPSSFGAAEGAAVVAGLVSAIILVVAGVVVVVDPELFPFSLKIKFVYNLNCFALIFQKLQN